MFFLTDNTRKLNFFGANGISLSLNPPIQYKRYDNGSLFIRNFAFLRLKSCSAYKVQ